MSKFKVGDRVKINLTNTNSKRWIKCHPWISSVGTVVDVYKYTRVEFIGKYRFPFLDEEILFIDESSPKEKKEIIKQLYREIHALETEVFEMFMETQ